MPITNSSLVDRLRDGDNQVAWRQFVSHYWRPLYAFAVRRGCSEQTAEDAVAETLLTLFQKRQEFHYDPARGKFRNWLCSVVRQNIALAKRRMRPKPAVDEADAALEVADSERICAENEFQNLFERGIYVAMLDVIRSEVEPTTYQAFEFLTVHGLSAKQISRILEISPNAVYQAQKRVTKRLIELGAEYRTTGQLGQILKDCLDLYQSPPVERSLTTRTETMQAEDLM